MSSDKKNLLLLYDRPQEPAFVPKGDKLQVFEITHDYLSDRYKRVSTEVISRFEDTAKEKIPLKKIELPILDFAEILELGRHENFSLFIPRHQRLAGLLIKIFMGVKTYEDLLSLAVWARDRVNPYMFNYCFSVALLHRKDTQGLEIVPLIQSFPDKFVDSNVIAKAREEASVVPIGSRMPVESPNDYASANDLEPEHRLAYFREDAGINLQYWYWHVLYPFDATIEIVNKNRRGELFYYFHQQIIARYNFERLCNSLKRVTRLTEWHGPIEEAYFPKLDSLVASRSYPARLTNEKLQDLYREQEQVREDVDQMQRWSDRIFATIHTGVVRDNRGKDIPLTENEGIDVLGNILESSIITPNKRFYGDLTNMGHVFISFIHDPDHRNKESFAVMGDMITTMRDPVFYRWHAYVNYFFQEYKVTLPPYQDSQLNYNGVKVVGVQVQTEGGQANLLNTFWQKSDVDLSHGMDFQPRGPVFASFRHLQHQRFTYAISVDNNGPQRQGTCRIFLAPALDERGKEWLFREQRNMFIELDKFVVNLNPGLNRITRQSTESSVTIAFEKTFGNSEPKKATSGEAAHKSSSCVCGWPQHMLIPKGTPSGLRCNLFVMISNYANDHIDQDTSAICDVATSYCGIKDKLYPDRRSMGYPFDRMPRDGVRTLWDFLTPNMQVQNVTIVFEDRIARRK